MLLTESDIRDVAQRAAESVVTELAAAGVLDELTADDASDGERGKILLGTATGTAAETDRLPPGLTARIAEVTDVPAGFQAASAAAAEMGIPLVDLLSRAPQAALVKRDGKVYFNIEIARSHSER
jgi:hypothetical protein